MACNDPEFHHWHLVPEGAHYELKVTGPDGFTAFATFDEAGPPGAVMWSRSEISPGPKIQLLGVPGGTHIVRVFVDIVSTSVITVRVSAKVTVAGSTHPSDYCHEITGMNGTRGFITHAITMA